MAWTAQIVDRTETEVFIDFLEDSVRKFANRYPIPAGGLEELRRVIGREILRLTAETEAKATITLGPITPITVPDPPTDPDQSTLDQFRTAVTRLGQYQKAVQRELIPSNDSDYTTLRAQVQQFISSRPALKDKLIQSL